MCLGEDKNKTGKTEIINRQGKKMLFKDNALIVRLLIH